ncbi:phage tail protein [Achromobacter xylosoxidans]|nr:phage tail protein [Achromobacter xylosoxidans]
MQELEHIEVGQQDNDGKGDLLRRGMIRVNANFAKVQTGVDAVELTAASAAQTATEAKTTADAAIPAAQKGMAGGVAPLDASGKVPAAHLPELADYIPVEEKGAAGGVAPLDAQGKVPAANLPAAEDSIPLSQKGQPGGVATLDTGGKVPVGQLPPIPTGPPAGSVAWWPLRSSIPAGQIPADGQTISRATFPDLAAMVAAGTVPVVAEADWLADPLKRGSYTLGDGSTTIRLPDLNGKSAGTLGALFLRGDGALSAGTNGLIQRDALQGHHHSQIRRQDLAAAGSAIGVPVGSGALANIIDVIGDPYTDGVNGIPRTAGETRPQNVAGAWTIQAFGAVTNPGSVDAAQLASDYAALNAAFQALRSQVFGVDQTLQDVTASRVFGVTYTNTTGRPIVLYVSTSGTTATSGLMGRINGLDAAFITRDGTAGALALSMVVPAGATYLVQNISSITGAIWREYR